MNAVTLLPLALLSLLDASVSAQSNLFLMFSDPGEYIGRGQTYITTNLSDLTLHGTPTEVGLSAFGFDVHFSGPNGAPLNVGVYANATGWPNNHERPGLDVSVNGSCNTICGDFRIFELHTDSDGNVDRFWVTFTQKCGCSSSALGGEIRYNSQLAPPLPTPRTLRVPGDFKTIQAALNNASFLTTDTILVKPGTYRESIRFGGKGARVLSTGGAAVTFLWPKTNTVGVAFDAGETGEASLCGFTIKNCDTGINLWNSSPTIASNVIKDCITGILSQSSSASILNNTITACKYKAIDMWGGRTTSIIGNIIRTNWAGITMFAAGTPSIYNNLIQGNQTDAISMVNWSDAEIYQNIISENGGNGILWVVPLDYRGPRVLNNTICNNRGAGISANGYDANVQVVNNTLVGNPAISVSDDYHAGIPIFQFNDIFSWTGNAYSGVVSNLDGIAGNISVDPAFACPTYGDYHLTRTSPCLDSGDNGAVTNLPATDFDGGNRLIAADINRAPNVDMGAFEFDPQSPATQTCAFVFCPSNTTIWSPIDSSGMVVEYPQPVATPGAIISCLPPSGTFFPVGTNIVYCSAGVGTNIDTCTFMITVLGKPQNDEIENATIIKSLPFEDVIDTTRATRSESDGNCLTLSGTVWYKLQSKKNQEITISSNGSDHQSNFAVLAKNREALDFVMCGQNGFIAHAGRTYYIMVENYGQGGQLHLTVTAQPILKVHANIAHTAVVSGGSIHYHGYIVATRPTTVLVYGSVWLPLPLGKIGIDYFLFRMECNGKPQTWDYTGAMPVTVSNGSVSVLLRWYTTDELESELGRSDNTVTLLPQFSGRKLEQSNSAK